MYEHRKERLLPHGAFLWRVAKHVAAATLIIAGWLVGGMAGMVFLIVASITLAPVVHRVFHRFHWDDNP